MKIGLVLQGGGTRGMYTAGVLDVFLEKGITFDGVIGVSAGAVHACSYLSGQRGRSLRYFKKYCADPRFMSLRSLLKTGDLVGADFCYHELPDRLDIYDNDAYLNCGVPFYACCTNLETGKAEYLSVKDMRGDIDILRASASIPFVSRIVMIDGKPYLDGGCADSVPIRAFRDMGYPRNVVILTRCERFPKEPKCALLSRLRYHKYPAFIHTMDTRQAVYDQTEEALYAMEKAGEIFLIRPSRPLPVRAIEKDASRIEAAYRIGRADALQLLDRLTSWLQQSK
ncbi:MAG: patatin family protein [Clostridia bacterium]|nr:patatin family protein [Clostridia bacterium]